MNCNRATWILGSPAMTVPAEELDEVIAHVAECPICRHILAQFLTEHFTAVLAMVLSGSPFISSEVVVATARDLRHELALACAHALSASA